MDEELNSVDNEELDDPIDEENIFPLTDEFGNTTNFEFLDLIEYEGEQYVVLLPVDRENEDDASVVVILRLDDSEAEDEEVYSAVDDQEIVDAVFNIFKEKFSDEYTFDDSEDSVNITNPETFADMSDVYDDDKEDN